MEDQITQYIQNILQREPAPGEVHGWIAIIEGNVATLEEVRQMIIDSTEAETNVYPVILTYQAIYGRVPDAGGLEYWTSVYASNLGLDDPATTTVNEALVEMLKAFVDPVLTPEFVDRYGANPTGSQFVAAAYQNVLNRLPDQDGLTYWQTRYAQIEASYADSGMTQEEITVQVRAEILEQFVNSAEYKTAAAEEVDAFLAAAADGDADAYDGSLWDKVSVDFTLTTATDRFTGGGSDDTFNAPLDLGIDGLVGVQTLQGSDVLDGGAGVDTLIAELNGTGTTANPRLSSIEILELTSLNGAGALDLSRATGVEEIWNIGSRNDLSVEGVGGPVLIGLDGVRGGTTFAVSYDDDVVFETQDVVANKVGSLGSGAVNLDIWMGNIEFLETLNLQVSNGVYLNLREDANWIENLNISGSGPLALAGEDDFNHLINLNSTGYNEDLNINVSGSRVLESVLTGDGNDAVVVNRMAVNGNFTADLGEGDNTLVVVHENGTLPLGPNNTMTGGRINLLDFSGQLVDDLDGPAIQNVQTLAFAQNTALAVNATLDLTGFDDALTTFSVADFDANGNDFTILEGPADLLITAAQEFDMDGGLLTVEGTVNLTVASAGANPFNSDVVLNGGVKSTTLETLVVNASALSDNSDADVVLSGGLDALVSVEVNAPGDDADLEINNATGDEFGALANVSVTAADDATLAINGNDGVVGVPGTQQTQQITINVTGSGGFPLSTSAGNIAFSSSSLPGGLAIIPYSTSVALLGNGSGLHDAGAASDVASWLNANAPGISATASGNVVTVTWDGFEAVDGLAYQAGLSGGTTGSLDDVMPAAVTAPIPPVLEVFGTGYEALETVVVDAGDDADVELTDVYGAFDLEVTAGDNAWIDLDNTGAVSVNVTATYVDIDVEGDVYGNRDLVEITVTSDSAVVTLEDNLTSFTTLDVSAVATNVVVDTSGAEFSVGAGQYVEYVIGATQDGTAAVDVLFTGNSIREVYNFVGEDLGEIVINGFTAGADPATGDRLDLSQFGINSAGDLIFTVDGANLVITDLGADDFSGSITLVGLGAQADDVAGFNIIYA